MRRCHTTSNQPTRFTVGVNIKGTDENPFQEAIDILIKSGHRFRWNLNLHSTILNLNEDKVSANNIEDIIYSMTDFFEKKDSTNEDRILPYTSWKMGKSSN
jgi:hypothetical protein